MNFAIARNSPLDPFLTWQAANGATYCKRWEATITIAVCEGNRQLTNSDCRCNGCGGLDNQTLPPLSPVYTWADFETTAADPDTPPGSARTATRNDDFDALDEIIDRFYEDPAPGDDFDDAELELDDEQLLALFPELARAEDDDTAPEFQRFTEYQEAAPRYAVYRGRCKKCGGYVENYREWNDDNVFRCLACGWRTGPEYERNKALHAAGGMII